MCAVADDKTCTALWRALLRLAATPASTKEACLVKLVAIIQLAESEKIEPRLAAERKTGPTTLPGRGDALKFKYAGTLFSGTNAL